MNRNATIAAAIGGVAVVVGAIVFVPRLARRTSFFRVRQIEVVGARYLSEADVVSRLHLAANASTFDALLPIQKAASSIPGVLSATVSRRHPGTIVINVREATPVGLVAFPDHVALMDSTGSLLPFDPARFPTSLPIVTQDSTAAVLLSRLMHTNPALYAMIDATHIDHGDVVLDIGSRRVRLRPEADDAILKSVTAVLGFLSNHTIAWREIDARYRHRIFVQKGVA